MDHLFQGREEMGLCRLNIPTKRKNKVTVALMSIQNQQELGDEKTVQNRERGENVINDQKESYFKGNESLW